MPFWDSAAATMAGPVQCVGLDSFTQHYLMKMLGRTWMWGLTYLNGAVAGTSTRDEGSSTAAIPRVQADARAGRSAASLFDTALNPIRVMRAVAGEVKSFRCAAGRLLTSPFTILLDC